MEAVKNTKSIVLGGSGFYVKDGCPVEEKETFLWTSDSEGRTWRPAELDFPSIPLEIEFHDARFGLLLTYEMKITERRGCGHSATSFRSSVQLTTDGGRTYREIYSAYHEDQDGITAVAMPTRNRIVLAAARGKILLSNDRGKTFKGVGPLSNQVDQQAGTTSGFQIDALTFGTAMIGYAGTNGRGTWRTEDGGRTWRLEPSHQSLAGLNLGDVAAVGPEKALAGGAHAIARRVVD